MRSIYASPLRVYLCLGLLALAGIYLGTKLPVSLFPNSSKPTISVQMPYGAATAEEFLNSYGTDLEANLRKISVGRAVVEKLEATYEDFSVAYKVEFKWGADPKEALKEVQTVVNAYAARVPKEVRDNTWVWNWNRSGGFLAVSFYSKTRSLTDVYNIIEPVLTPQFAKVEDAERVGIYNPESQEVLLELIPETLAAYRLYPRQVEEAVERSLRSMNGGSISMGPKNLVIQLTKQATNLETLGQIPITTPSGARIHLSDVARIDLQPNKTEERSFKTSGAPSLILFANPKAGGNVKRMAEDILKIVDKSLTTLPPDIEYKKLVDPSEFIRNAVNNVTREVALGAFLAVLILYLFIGSLKNVGTAAIEIPMSMVIAFILMYFSGMNLNIISLGGLALSAGMNVDASVVVMENIFRHFEGVKGKLTPADRLRIITQAVHEVRFPVIASTIASLVVFAPLAFTSALSNAILGDLAKTVVFSHGLSAIVALILVPTVRLQLMSREKDTHHVSPIERQLKWIENTYARLLGALIARPRLQLQVYGALIAVLVLLITVVLPKLPKEIIGTPDTDWVVFAFGTSGNNSLRQMESIAEETEASLLAKFGKDISYTFTQVNGANNANVMARLKDKRQMTAVWKGLEKAYPNTPFMYYSVAPWNPAELPIPDPPHLRLEVRGGKVKERKETARAIEEMLEEKQIFPRISVTPSAARDENIVFEPYRDQWMLLEQSGAGVALHDIADLARVATQGRVIGEMSLDERMTPIRIAYPENRLRSPEDLGSLPIGIGNQLIPLKALGKIEVRETPPLIYRENGQNLVLITGRQNKGDERKIAPAQKEAARLVEAWNAERLARNGGLAQGPTVHFEDAAKDMNDAISQLTVAIALSILLIFLTMVVQFGGIVNALLVLVAVPLGIIGVVLSLWMFGSTISLNSALGVILLNGLAVANSIILVDFMKRLVDGGMEPRAAAVEAARKRLRPILITSLTTLLGMLPIALGHGEGGRILQPLGIAVGGGLWVSMGLTLFIVPALQVAYLEFIRRRRLGTALVAPVVVEAGAPVHAMPGWNAPFFSRILGRGRASSGILPSDDAVAPANANAKPNSNKSRRDRTRREPEKEFENFDGPTDTLQ